MKSGKFESKSLVQVDEVEEVSRLNIDENDTKKLDICIWMNIDNIDV